MECGFLEYGYGHLTYGGGYIHVDIWNIDMEIKDFEVDNGCGVHTVDILIWRWPDLKSRSSAAPSLIGRGFPSPSKVSYISTLFVRFCRDFN